jgi:hypothetical protein
MNESTWALGEEAVHQTLARNGRASSGEVLCSLLWLLRDEHRSAVRAFATRAYREGFELSDPRARSIAERIKDHATRTGEGHRPESLTSGMKMVVDVLGELIALWDFGERGERGRNGS